MTDAPIPPGWGKEPLSKFMDTARHNSFATFANCPAQYGVLSAIDGVFSSPLITSLIHRNGSPHFFC